ncbi:MAG: hypothetical protein AB1633_05545 [Elusimicrobiota bacterium]
MSQKDCIMLALLNDTNFLKVKKGHLFKNFRGSAMISVMLVVLSLISILMAVIPFTVKESRKISKKYHRLTAFYAAEAAVSKALYEYSQSQMPLRVDTINSSDISKSAADSDGVLGNKFDLVSGYDETIQPFYEKNIFAEISMAFKGSYLGISSKCAYKGNGVRLDYIFGARIPKYLDAALILFENTPLEMQGSQIHGKIKAPVKPNAWLTMSEYEKLPDTVHISDFKTWKESIKIILQQMAMQAQNSERVSGAGLAGQPVVYSADNVPDFKNNDTVYLNSHLLIEGNKIGRALKINGPATIIVAGDVQLAEYVILSNVNIYASGSITLFGRSNFIDGILFAQGQIAMTEQSSLRGEIITMSNVEIGGDVVVEMPSVIYSEGAKGWKGQKAVLVTNNAFVSGTIVCSNQFSLLMIDYDAKTFGIIYSAGKIDIRGTVCGTVVAKGFTDSNEKNKKNVFIDGEITSAGMAENLVVPLSIAEKPDLAVISWRESVYGEK